MSDTVTNAERWADGAIHAIGVCFAGFAAIWLGLHANGIASTLSLGAYATGMLAMIGASAAYNLWPPGAVKEWLRRLDHATIFLMIAGSYTPFVVLRLPTGTAEWLGGFVWCGAIAGIALKLLYPRRFERLSIALYLALGWAIVLAYGPLSDQVARGTVILIVVGGALFTCGLPFCLVRRLPFQHAAWHSFVLAAMACHFAAISGEFI